VKEDDPCAFRVFEVYASEDAYAAHLNSPNFGAVKKFAESGGLAGPLDIEKHALL
jgi:quinol monooxygenase YgiN